MENRNKRIVAIYGGQGQRSWRRESFWGRLARRIDNQLERLFRLLPFGGV